MFVYTLDDILSVAILVVAVIAFIICCIHDNGR